MRAYLCVIVGIVWFAPLTPVRAAPPVEDVRPFCRDVASVSVAAAVLRDRGATAETAGKELQGHFSTDKVEAGVNTAFAYKQLKNFALADVSSVYCIRMLKSNGKPEDIERLWIRTHYERALECSTQGSFEREPYLKCWDAQQVRDSKGNEKIVLSVMNLEYVLAEKRVCEARFPKYKLQNQQAFDSSAVSKISSEAIIDAYARIGAKQGLLLGLQDLRLKTDSIYLGKKEDELEKRCEAFALSPELTRGR